MWTLRAGGLVFLCLAGAHLAWGGKRQFVAYLCAAAAFTAASEALAALLRWRHRQLRQADFEYVNSIHEALDD
jgi:hypothetical protein